MAQKIGPSRDPDGRRLFGARQVVALCLAVALNPINSSMLATALVPIKQAFPGQEEVGAWLVASLYLTAAIAQPVLGKFADSFGAKRILLYSVAVLGLGAVIGAIAGDMLTLLASRVLIGIGTSGGFPCAVSILNNRAGREGVEPSTRLLGILAAMGAVSIAVGPPLGGFLTEWLGWRGVFVINLPLAMLSLAVLLFLVPKDEVAKPTANAIDWTGIALFTIFMTALVILFMNLVERLDWIALAIAAFAFGALVRSAKRKEAPFINVGLLRSNRQLSMTYLHHFVFNFVNYCFFYSIPQWAQLWLNMPLAKSGLLLMPAAISSALASLAPTRGRIGCIVEITGVAALTGMSAALLILDANTSTLTILAMSFLLGLGYGVLNMSNQQRILDYVPREQGGSAAGLLRTAAYCGAILSAPLVDYLISGHLGDNPMRLLSFVMLPLMLVPTMMVILGIRRGRYALAQ